MSLLKTIKAPLLEQLKRDIEAKVPPEQKRDFLAIVVAGLKLMYDPRAHEVAVKDLDAALKKYPLPMAVAIGTLQVLAVVARESRGTIQVAPAISAAMVLMAYVWEFVQVQRQVQVTPAMVSTSSRVVVACTLQFFGIDKDKLAQGVELARRGTAPAGQPPAAPMSPAQPGV